jgi:hypothetical protein
MLGLDIGNGTTALTGGGEPLQTIELQPIGEPPAPPADCHIIGLAYDFGPEGATFDPPITLTWAYNPGQCPEGVAEGDLVIAYYDVETGQWVELECSVDTVNHVITANVSHFTVFAILGKAALTSPSAPLIWWLITFIVAAALIILGLGVYLLIRRGRSMPAT